MTVRCEDTEYDLMAAKFGINGYAVLKVVLIINPVYPIGEVLLPMLKYVR